MEVSSPSSPVDLGSRMGNLGAHGIPNIQRASTARRRLLWAALFLGGVAAFLIQGTLLVGRLLRYDVAVNVELSYKPLVRFPAVTVCNLNSIRRSEINNIEDLYAKIRGYTALMYQAETVVDYNEQCDSFGLAEIAVEATASIAYDQRHSTGHTLENMLLSCSFNGYPCTRVNFTHFYNYLYGNCYTFNFDKAKVKEIGATGPSHGLSMEFDIEQGEYMDDLQNSAGMKVFVDHQNQMPFPEDKGVIVSPGQETYISLNRVVIDRLDQPYTNCTTGGDTIFSDFYGNVSYSLLACEKNCVVQTVMERCQCGDPRYRFDDAKPLCSSSNDTQRECVEWVWMDYRANILQCGCVLPCKEVLFEETVSSAVWPNENYKETLASTIARKYDTDVYDVYGDGDGFINSNFLKINVFYSSLQFQNIYQVPDYDVPSMVSDLGGQFGLWMGFSFLTLFEFLELIFDLLQTVFARGLARSGKAVSGEGSKIKPVSAFCVSSSLDKMPKISA